MLRPSTASSATIGTRSRRGLQSASSLGTRRLSTRGGIRSKGSTRIGYPIKEETKKDDIPTTEQFIDKRDYIGALTAFKYDTSSLPTISLSSSISSIDIASGTDNSISSLLWEAYIYYQLGDVENAIDTYEDLLSSFPTSRGGEEEIETETAVSSKNSTENGLSVSDIHYNLACLYFHLQMYEKSEESALAAITGTANASCPLDTNDYKNDNGDDMTSPQINRILYYATQNMGDATKALKYRDLMDGTAGTEEDMAKAAMLYSEDNFEDAIDIYKRLLTQDKTHTALNAYIALCYYKMDDHDASQEALSVYDKDHTDSLIAANLRACNNYRIYSGKTALDTWKDIPNLDKLMKQNDYFSHNMVVFNDGQRALQVFPRLFDNHSSIARPARLNLSIHYLRCGEVECADEILNDITPSMSQEYILKAIVNVLKAQEEDCDDEEKVDLLSKAQSLFKLVGSSQTEEDTIAGRQAMASHYLLQDQFDDAIVYLSSIKDYMSDDDDFNYNYGVCLTKTGDYSLAEEILCSIQDPSYKEELCYMSCLARCYIMGGKPEKAWDITKQVREERVETENKSLIHLYELIANDCYQHDHFLYAARSFHALMMMDGYAQDVTSGISGSVMGFIRQLALKHQYGGKIPSGAEGDMIECLKILETYSSRTSTLKQMTAIKKWAKKVGARTN